MKGIDISEYQKSVDFAQVKADGYGFVILKATEGATFNAPTFHDRYGQAKSAGLLEGAYCFGRPETSIAVEEARHFVEVVNAAGGFHEWPELPNHYPGVFDYEDNGGKTDPAEVQQYGIEWLNEFKTLTGKPGILYTGANFFETYGLQHVLDVTGALLWVADYSKDPNLKEVMWQANSVTHVQGVSGNVDEDILKASAPAPVTKPDTSVYFVIAGDTLSRISLSTHVPVGVLAAFNNISNPNVIEVGQRLHIPTPYRIKAGDTFWGLSQKFGVPVEQLERTNPINPYLLQTGDLVFV